MSSNERSLPSTCWECSTTCGSLLTVSDGRVTKVGPNPEHPVSKGAFCAKGTGFVGEDALASHTPARRIVSLLFDTPEAIPIHDEPIYFEGRVVGQITSSAWSYRFGRSVALAMIDAPLERLATEDVVPGFEVEIACTRFPASASLKPAKEVFQ